MFANYNHLAEFLVAAESTNLVAAAEKLHISSSAMSKHLASLEVDLGCQLLERDRHSFRLTEAGRAVYEVGAPLLVIGSQVESAVQASTPFRIIVLFDSTLFYQSIAQATRLLGGEEKRFNIVLEEDTRTRNPFSAVLEGSVDLVIYDSFIRHTIPDSLQADELASLSYFAIMHRSHSLADRENVFVEDLRDWPLTRLVGNFQLLEHIWSIIREECLATGFTPRTRERRIYHPTGAAMIDVDPEEIFILPEGSQSMVAYRNDPTFSCIRIADMEHLALMAYDPANKTALQFIEVVRMIAAESMGQR